MFGCHLILYSVSFDLADHKHSFVEHSCIANLASFRYVQRINSTDVIILYLASGKMGTTRTTHIVQYYLHLFFTFHFDFHLSCITISREICSTRWMEVDFTENYIIIFTCVLTIPRCLSWTHIWLFKGKKWLIWEIQFIFSTSWQTIC